MFFSIKSSFFLLFLTNKKTILASVFYLRKFQELSKAVQLVSIAKLRKLTKSIESREFALSIAVEMFDELNKVASIYRQCTFVVITSERSCCGKLNTDIVHHFTRALDLFHDGNKQARIITVG